MHGRGIKRSLDLSLPPSHNGGIMREVHKGKNQERKKKKKKEGRKEQAREA
jgi:hypothetical protein